ncbi:MAG: hypothetical protein WC879_18990, partial [Melioribacteraceae bacterium]
MDINISKRNKKYIRLISLIFFLMLLSGVLSPILIEKEKNNWDKTLIDKIDYVANSISHAFETRTDFLITISSHLKKDLHSLNLKSSIDQRPLFNILANKKYQNLSVQIYDSKGNLTAWNSEPVLEKQELIKTGSYINQSFFSSQKLLTHLALADTLHTGNEVILIIVSQPVE